jgi:ribosomal protein S18 acetylase RimI-like enzyme
MEIRELRPDEYAEAGRATALAYEVFFPGEDSPNADYRTRVADVAGRAGHAVVLGAFDGDRPVGSVTLELDGRIPGGHPRSPLGPGQANVRMLGVHPDVQRRGIGRALMEAALARARDAGKRRVTLETTEAMSAAHGLYEGMGFVRLDDQVFDDGFRLRTYQLDLG